MPPSLPTTALRKSLRFPSLTFSSYLTATALLAGLVSSPVATPVLAADPWAPNITVIGSWDDNATNANAAADRIGAWRTNADLIASDRYDVSRDDSLHFTLHAGGEWWPRFNRLMQGSAGARIEWRHKFGLGALAPVFSVELAADAVAAKESGRRGTASGVLFSLRKRFNDGWRATLSHDIATHAARLAVYDRTGVESAIEVDRDIGAITRLSFRAGYRDGDILSHGTPPRPDLVALAPHRMPVDTFGRPMVAYSISAHSLSLGLGLTRAIDESSAWIFNYTWRDTNRGSLRYVNQLVSLSLVHQY